ncbi:hypothetical protein TSOC_005043 [Tetrabaena socialis]|uniref:Chalcone isomerase domain-containing protein n=1 Tax=Tetrabaena socialis TaxID=47790 RepID=A0A2J8A7A4_9CHLO|nr:hypothetical protein TSOC_005043 [Tetrabaena socialis]|eukprot:PNH08409.1 hypothetical protein TSOC_005043 [Tetrabaena socialis]
MLEPEDDCYEDAPLYAPASSYGGGVDGPGLGSQLIPMPHLLAAEASASRGSHFPLVFKPLGLPVYGTQPGNAQDQGGLALRMPAGPQSPPPQGPAGGWSYHRHHQPSNGRGQHAACDSCGNHCPAAHDQRPSQPQPHTHSTGQHAHDHGQNQQQQHHHHQEHAGQALPGRQGDGASSVSGGGTSSGGGGGGAQAGEQHLLAVGSRQWGNGGCAGGDLVTEAGGRVLGRVHSPALSEALFDLYLGDQPVSKKAKAAAGAALLRLAEGDGAEGASGGAVHYRLQPGERLLCGGGGSVGGCGGADPSACVLELP